MCILMSHWFRTGDVESDGGTLFDSSTKNGVLRLRRIKPNPYLEIFPIICFQGKVEFSLNIRRPLYLEDERVQP